MGLTLGDVADQLSSASVELGGGTLKTAGGDILVRVKDRRDYARQYARLPILTLEDGSRVLLEDIATVREGFEDSNTWANFDGQPAVSIEVYRVGDQTPAEVAGAAKAVMERLNKTLPAGIELTVLRDGSEIFIERADLLIKNAIMGLILVFVLLALFLETRLAFWVSLGIPVSFLGSFIFLGASDFSINMISMFAFIVTLGIVVDDAVVVGENIYHYRNQGLPFYQASVKGVREVAIPVIFSVLTNLVSFMPMLFIPGFMGKVFKVIPLVVAAVFGVSLIESLLILPAHLSHRTRSQAFWPLNHLERWQGRFSRSFESFVSHQYGSFISLLLGHRYTVMALGLALMLGFGGYVASGRMGMELFPMVESDYAYVSATLPYGSPLSRLLEVEKKLVKAGEKVTRENGGDKLSKGIFSVVSSNGVSIRLFLTPADVRPLSTAQVSNLWRREVGTISGLETISFEANRGGPGSGKNLTVMLSHQDKNQLEKAGEELAAKLAEFSIVHDIDDGSARGKRQYDIKLHPLGERMGLTSQSVALQVRHAFQGAVAVKQQRGRNEVTVRVRLPENERITEATLEDMVLQAPKGEVFLRDAVEMIPGRAYTSIERTNGRRDVAVTANVRPPSQAENVIKSLTKEILPALMVQYPGLSYSFQGTSGRHQGQHQLAYHGPFPGPFRDIRAAVHSLQKLHPAGDHHVQHTLRHDRGRFRPYAHGLLPLGNKPLRRGGPVRRGGQRLPGADRSGQSENQGRPHSLAGGEGRKHAALPADHSDHPDHLRRIDPNDHGDFETSQDDDPHGHLPGFRGVVRHGYHPGPGAVPLSDRRGL